MDNASAPEPVPATAAEAPAKPKRTRRRKNGWTNEAQIRFVMTLAATGSVREASDAVGMHYSSAYRLRLEPRGWEFARAWDSALAIAYDRLREIAFDRIMRGTEQPVYYKGEKVDTRIVHNDRLLMFMIAHTAKQPRQGPSEYARAMVELANAPEEDSLAERQAFHEARRALDDFIARQMHPPQASR
ncbi:MAG: hypothetical protein CFE37_01200 [Alphaproteobacteria bacterium PA4]|nr:MAG: hypothetical protein CFE37_01200 [Alphaproteobacteria bacterium PA4]